MGFIYFVEEIFPLKGASFAPHLFGRKFVLHEHEVLHTVESPTMYQSNGRQSTAATQNAGGHGGGGNRAAAVAGAGGYNSSEFVDY